MHHCPLCDVPLKPARRGRVRIFLCPRCAGYAVSVGQLPEVGFDVTGVADAPESGQGQVRPGRFCPECRRPTRRVPALASHGAVEIEVCERCQLAWLDPVEHPIADRRRRDPVGQAALWRDDDPEPAASWSVTWLLAAALAVIAIFEALWQVAATTPGLDASGWMGIVTTSILPVDPWTAFTCLAFLVLVGGAVEEAFGSLRYVVLGAASMAAALASVAVVGPDRLPPGLGVIGLVTGAVTGFVLALPEARMWVPWRFWRLPLGWSRQSAHAGAAAWLLAVVVDDWVATGVFPWLQLLGVTAAAAATWLLLATWSRLDAGGGS